MKTSKPKLNKNKNNLRWSQVVGTIPGLAPASGLPAWLLDLLGLGPPAATALQLLAALGAPLLACLLATTQPVGHAPLPDGGLLPSAPSGSPSSATPARLIKSLSASQLGEPGTPVRPRAGEGRRVTCFSHM